jgi:hypothetical protein
MTLTLLALGHLPASAIESLLSRLPPIEAIELLLPLGAPLEEHKGELNRAIDAATNDWILIVRQHEVVDEQLAAEIALAMHDARAWGFRIRTIPIYCGRPLRLATDDGEIRLFHRRHYARFEARREARAMRVQGTVVRLDTPLRAVTFATAQEHRGHLAARFAPHSAVRRALIFARNAIALRSIDSNTLSYVWIEAGFDHGGQPATSGL